MDALPLILEIGENIFEDRKVQSCIDGIKLKKLRISRKLTLKTVSVETGLSMAMISRVENESISPSIESLSKLAKYFNVDISSLFKEVEENTKYEITRKNERKTITSIISEEKNRNGYFFESMSYRKKEKKMEPFLVTLTQKIQGVNIYRHEGESFIYVIKGTLELHLEDRELILEEGDGVYFDASIEHRLRSKDDSEVIALGIKRVNGKDTVIRN